MATQYVLLMMGLRISRDTSCLGNKLKMQCYKLEVKQESLLFSNALQGNVKAKCAEH